MNSKINKFFNRLSLKEQELLVKRLSFLIKSGVPILESLKMIKGQTRASIKLKIMNRLIEDVANGQYLYTSLNRFKNIFGNFVINIIRVGEMGGILDQNLNYLAQELKKRRELRSKVVSAFVYPIFILVATLGVTGLLVVYLFPKILPIFKSLNVKLPFTTKFLIFFSDFLLHYGLYSILGVILLIIGLTFLLKTKPIIRLLLNKFILTLPLIGTLVRNYNMTNFSRTLGLLIKSDVKLVESITILAETTPNLVYRKEIYNIAKNVVRGERISTSLEKKPRLFPPMISQMVAIGETTGHLSESLLYLSNFYENELDEMTKNLSSTLEPMLMILMGIIVGFVAISIITPIYEITQNLHP